MQTQWLKRHGTAAHGAEQDSPKIAAGVASG